MKPKIVIHNHYQKPARDARRHARDIDYRSSAHQLSAFGENWKKQGKSKAALKQYCKDIGLDARQCESVVGGFENASDARRSK